MEVLVFGGNVFVGRAIAEAALGRGHSVTTLTRGVSGPSPEGAISVFGDRSEAGGLAGLEGGHWDVAIDVSSSPVQVQSAIGALGGSVPHYVFMSTTSVYSDQGTGPLTVASQVASAATEKDEGVAAAYANLKVRCEQIVRAHFPAGHLVIRPGLVVGPGDPTDRFTYWVERATKPGVILAPGDPDRRIRFTDVRDLSTWVVTAAEHRIHGTFNAVGPAGRVSMSMFLEACLAVVDDPHRQLRWVSDEFLVDQGIVPYTEMPLWVPSIPELQAFADADSAPAEQLGLAFRPIHDTINDTFAWATTHDQRARQNGLSAD